LSKLVVGIPAPMFTAPSPINPTFAFGSLGGRYVLLAFLPPPGAERDAALKLVSEAWDIFREDHRLFFGVLPDQESFDAAKNRPPFRWFADVEGEVSRKYGLIECDGSLSPAWVLIDPSMRILAFAKLHLGAAMMAKMRSLPPPDEHAGTPIHAPILIVPRVIEPALCERLVRLYQEDGGAPSGVMQVRDGKTVPVLNDMKSRRDAHITDPALQAALRRMLDARLVPEIERAFQYKATRIERYIVACYDAGSGGFFRPHRDNTTPGTAHRRFAVSINLNDDFEGGDLRFPEFGSRTYRPPLGGAVVFSCSLLHEATPVTRGVRYATLPFLYDDAAAEIRRANLHTLELEPSDEAN
jgi:predicted 2-oxoglutarate/Fe(II)-dependent dioxygenase YbiX/peroxiredoxin